MRLSTRFTVTMIAYVVLILTALGALNYRIFEAAGLPGATDRFKHYTGGLADGLEAATAGARADVLGLRAAAPVGGVAQASLAAGAVPDPASLDGWRAPIASRCVAVLAARPDYRACGLIGIADGGRDLVRVDRSPADGTIRVVADADPRGPVGRDALDTRDLIRKTLAVADGEVFVSPVKAAPSGAPARRAAILDVAAPVRAPDKAPFAIAVITIDLASAFVPVRAATVPSRPILLTRLPPRSMFVVDDRGDYLVHPDPDREFGFVSGHPSRLQDDFPGLSDAVLRMDEPGPFVLSDRNGTRFVLGMAAARLAGATRVTVVQAIPYAALYAAGQAVFNSSLITGLFAVVGAIVLAVPVARSMSRPIVQMTDAVTAFGRGEPMAVPTRASGEIRVLARAFARMAEEVTEKTAAMRRSAEILDLIMTRMADAVLLVDESATIVFANAAAKDLLGERAAVGWNAWRETYQAYRADGLTPLPFEQGPLVRAIRGDSVDNFDMVFRVRGEQRSVHIVISARPIEAAGGAGRGAVMVFRDVTAWKETERLLRDSQKMEAIGQLTGGVAHDFNNILAVITGTIDILKAGVADRPQLATIARMIDQAAMRGADLTRQLLAFARKQPLQPRETDINALILDTARLLRPTLGEQIEIESMLDDDAWPAMIDRTQLSTALLNLALNARDAMANGGKLTFETANVILDEVYAHANAEVKPGSYVMIAVSDSGVGIPAALREKVFDPFFTTKEIGKGTGLGLSMVYGFVKQSGGHIKIYSEEGHGTTIKLYLPRSGEEAKMEEAVPLPPVEGGHETILVVEDDVLVRNYVIAQLESLGYAVIAAASGAEALAFVDRETRFDLLFTDIVMPGGMNGRELADEVARRRPGTKVLYTSGYTEEAIVHHGRLDPDVALLNKPYRKAELARKIREVLGPPAGM